MSSSENLAHFAHPFIHNVKYMIHAINYPTQLQTKMQLTIIIVNYNGGKFLTKCLDSVLSQNSFFNGLIQSFLIMHPPMTR